MNGILQTDRLRLRKFTLADAPFILELLNEPAFIQNIGDRGVRTVQDAEQYLEKGPLTSYARHGFGLWCVELTETGDQIGMCGLIKRDALADVDLGYAYLPQYWGCGYAAEAALACREYARAPLGLKRLVAIVDPANQGSIRVLEKAGMKFERLIRLTPDDIELKFFAIDI
jgi:[ribosomal protein S5]-alanine N-acetyltransferase